MLSLISGSSLLTASIFRMGYYSSLFLYYSCFSSYSEKSSISSLERSGLNTGVKRFTFIEFCPVCILLLGALARRVDS